MRYLHFEYLSQMLYNSLQTHLSDSLYFRHTTFLTLPTSENRESPIVLICNGNVSDELKSLGVFFFFLRLKINQLLDKLKNALSHT